MIGLHTHPKVGHELVRDKAIQECVDFVRRVSPSSTIRIITDTHRMCPLGAHLSFSSGKRRLFSQLIPLNRQRTESSVIQAHSE